MPANLLAGLDPRAKLVAFLAVQALLFVPSAQPLSVRLFAVAVPLIALLLLAGRSWRLWLRTLALAAPFLAFLAFSAWLLPSAGRPQLQLVILALIGKSLLVFLSLSLFVINEEPRRLLQAMRQVGLPRSAIVIVAIGSRFSGQWHQELEGMARAWAGRNFRALPKLRRARYLGRAFPLFFERLLDGAVHIHDAMVSRGFRGVFPAWKRLVFSRQDAVFLFFVAAASLLITVL